MLLKQKLFTYQTVDGEQLPGGDPELRAGTIQYSRPGLFATIFFLCLGSGLFFIIPMLVGNATPLLLEKLSASNRAIALVGTTLPYILNMVITPVLSFQSDRYRSRLGRRMPYLLIGTPLIALFLLGVGFYAEIGSFCSTLFPTFNQNSEFWILAALLTGYNIFYLVNGSIIYYVYPDVIPGKYIGRFMSLLQLVGSGAGFFFSRYLLKYIETDLQLLFVGLTIAFLIGMGVIFLFVREGNYPPIEEEKRFPGLIGIVVSYVRECYSVPFYYAFFLMMALSETSLVCRNMFNLLYAKNTLGLTVEEAGIIAGWCGAVSCVLCYPIGMVVDKIGSLRVYGAGLVLVILVNIYGFFFVHDGTTFYISSIALAVVYAIQMTSTLPVFVDILPRELYGQFSSANALLRALFMAIGAYLGGWLFDWIKDYQYIFAWDFLFTCAALGCFAVLYVSWKKRGGREHYVAPLAGHHQTN